MSPPCFTQRLPLSLLDWFAYFLITACGSSQSRPGQSCSGKAGVGRTASVSLLKGWEGRAASRRQGPLPAEWPLLPSPGDGRTRVTTQRMPLLSIGQRGESRKRNGAGSGKIFRFTDSCNSKFLPTLPHPGPYLWQGCFLSTLGVSFKGWKKRNLARLVIHSFIHLLIHSSIQQISGHIMFSGCSLWNKTHSFLKE